MTRFNDTYTTAFGSATSVDRLQEVLQLSVMNDLIAQSDDLFHNDQYEQSLDVLGKQVSTYKHPEIYWRLAQSCYYNTLSLPEKPGKLELKTRFTEMQEYAQAGLELDKEDANCCTWYGISVDELAMLESVYEWLKQAPTSRMYYMKALITDPDNYTARTALGIWCFMVADMHDFIRMLQNAIFTSPPDSTYENALGHLLRSEELFPNCVLRNMLYLAKCYKALKDSEAAARYCKAVIEFQGRGYAVEEAKEEVRQILLQL
ncbi:hypothetical protein P879_00530 [Paragonimus westermani]|uniref:Regulator of microtubule dynamics protein 1 n=1 Tax=Paragonimus westermani TaxID=34504 RepID=A0A8T0DWF5_9TREM|nr:hypothetical protein P879_00530 [Paragonimus westermani]